MPREEFDRVLEEPFAWEDPDLMDETFVQREMEDFMRAHRQISGG